jgi:hypothetical protein
MLRTPLVVRTGGDRQNHFSARSKDPFARGDKPPHVIDIRNSGFIQFPAITTGQKIGIFKIVPCLS